MGEKNLSKANLRVTVEFVFIQIMVLSFSTMVVMALMELEIIPYAKSSMFAMLIFSSILTWFYFTKIRVDFEFDGSKIKGDD